MSAVENQCDNIEIVKLLLEKGANVNSIDWVRLCIDRCNCFVL